MNRYPASRALTPLVSASLLLLATSLLPVPARATSSEQVPVFAPDCLKQAEDWLKQTKALMGNSGAPQNLPAVAEPVAALLAARGVHRAWLATDSLISPPPRYALVQLPDEAPNDADAAAAASPLANCPLGQTYLAYSPGGFVPQPPRFFGPLPSGAAAR
ncbi:MAG: hypothetical protein ACK4S6_13525 [Roseateles asaccharophilus]|uniref:hypothetical protein n=1 Tax=Roseateles asaccharophilus TaxID=582607 RepID=UPI00391C1A94